MRTPVGAPTPPSPLRHATHQDKAEDRGYGQAGGGRGVVNKNDFLQFPFSNAFK